MPHRVPDDVSMQGVDIAEVWQDAKLDLETRMHYEDRLFEQILWRLDELRGGAVAHDARIVALETSKQHLEQRLDDLTAFLHQQLDSISRHWHDRDTFMSQSQQALADVVNKIPRLEWAVTRTAHAVFVPTEPSGATDTNAQPPAAPVAPPPASNVVIYKPIYDVERLAFVGPAEWPSNRWRLAQNVINVLRAYGIDPEPYLGLNVVGLYDMHTLVVELTSHDMALRLRREWASRSPTPVVTT